MSDQITAQERALIDAAIAAGQATDCTRKKRGPAPMPPYDPSAPVYEGSKPKLRSELTPPRMSVKEAIEWAFATERAQMDADVLLAASGAARGKAMSPEAVLISRAALGTTVDVSCGTSAPADDADIIASIVREAAPDFGTAIWIADLARVRRVPDYLADERPQLHPVEWVYGRGGRRGRTADSEALGVEGWPEQSKRTRRGGIRKEPVLFTPCYWSPDAKQIRQARQSYLLWWEVLLYVGATLRNTQLDRFEVTDEMPPMRPWKGEDNAV